MKIIQSVWKYFIGHLLQFTALIAILFLFIPNIVVLIFSFNAGGRYNYTFNGFSLHYWRNICTPTGICESVKTSFVLGITTTVVATFIGTLLAYALVKYHFTGDGLIKRITFLPMATPDLVLAASLLALFINWGIPLGFVTVFIAHVSFMLSYVVTTVKSRIQGSNNTLEQAAMDLYANPLQTYIRITLPNIAPGIAAAAVMAFALSFDDFIVTNFNSGAVVTFPVYVWTAAVRGVPGQVNVIGSIFFLTTILATAIYSWFSIRSNKKRQ